jgi:hypothetical protein
MRSMPIIGGQLRDLHDCDARNRAVAKVVEALTEVGSTLRRLASAARIFFIDCRRYWRTASSTRHRCRVPTPIWVATSLKRSSATLPRLQRKPDVSWSQRVRQAHAWGSDPWTTNGPRRCLVARSRFSPMPRAESRRRSGGDAGLQATLMPRQSGRRSRAQAFVS